MPQSNGGGDLTVGGVSMPSGQRTDLELPIARLPNGTFAELPVAVVRGSRPGPTVCLSAALHGDEINGAEIIRRVLHELAPPRLQGAVLAVPVVNVFGFLHQDRYLPDRRDLNRHFPGNKRGSLASQLAALFVEEILQQADYAIDFHTGSLDRINLPQIRVSDLEDEGTQRIANAFAAPLLFESSMIDGSLRKTAHKMELPLLLFEGGEPQRLNEPAIQMGVAGTLRVLHELEMIKRRQRRGADTRVVPDTRWVRAPRSGIVRMRAKLGQLVEEDEVLATVGDPWNDEEAPLTAPEAGMVIGHAKNPLIYKGDAVVHLGEFES